VSNLNKLNKIIDRAFTKKETLSFGVNFLDRALIGICKNDLIVVTAPTGSGKTELVSKIAESNIMAEKRVLFFALEAEEDEILSRTTYRVAANIFWKELNSIPNKFPRYSDWYHGTSDPGFRKYAELAKKKMEPYVENINYIYREKELTIKNFEQIVGIHKDSTDLIIVDHLNYFDTDDTNEIRAISDVMKGLRDTALIYGIPIILVCHMRKKDNRLKKLVPDIDDIHGTSNIAKIATKVILVSKEIRPEKRINKFLSPTYFRIGKYRVDGDVIRYVGLVNFNVQKNDYDENFDLGFLNYEETEFNEIKIEDRPTWCIGS